MTTNDSIRSRTSQFVFIAVAGLTGCETSPPRPQPQAEVRSTEDQLGVAREKHAAVALMDAQGVRRPRHAALVIGGIDGPAGSSFFADVFDGAIDKPTWRSSLHRGAYSGFGIAELARVDLQATAMDDGKILVTGGSVCATIEDVSAMPCDPRMEGCNCTDNRTLRNTVLLFDPEQPDQTAWKPMAWYMKFRHSRHSVSVWHDDYDKVDHVFIFGGYGKSLQDTMEHFVYHSGRGLDQSLARIDLVQGTTSMPDGGVVDAGDPNGELQSPDEWGGHTATMIPVEDSMSITRRILVVGGRQSANGPCGDAYLVEVDKNGNQKWPPVPLPVPEAIQLPCVGHSAEVIGPKENQFVAIIGGENEKGTPRRDVILFDVQQLKILSEKFDMNVEHSFGATAVLGSGSFIVAGGIETGGKVGQRIPGRHIERCNPVSKSCVNVDELKCSRAHHSMTKLGRLPNVGKFTSVAEHLLVVGGSGADNKNTAECADSSDTGFRSEIIYLNETCGLDADCSPDYECAGPNGTKSCRPSSR